MQISQKTAVATHILLCLSRFQGDQKLTSDVLAGSAGVNSVIIRTLLGRLKSAGLVTILPGVGGASLALPPEEITLLSIFCAVEEQVNIFAIHKHPNPACPIGSTIRSCLAAPFAAAKKALEEALGKVTLADLLAAANHPA